MSGGMIDNLVSGCLDGSRYDDANALGRGLGHVD